MVDFGCVLPATVLTLCLNIMWQICSRMFCIMISYWITILRNIWICTGSFFIILKNNYQNIWIYWKKNLMSSYMMNQFCKTNTNLHHRKIMQMWNKFLFGKVLLFYLKNLNSFCWHLKYIIHIQFFWLITLVKNIYRKKF